MSQPVGEIYNYYSDELSHDGVSSDDESYTAPKPLIEYVPMICTQPRMDTDKNSYAFVSPRRPSQCYVGLPPIHHSKLTGGVFGRNQSNFWLPDSGTSAHMTPYIEDILPGSLETFVSNVTVANSRTTKVTHRGTVHILLHNYQDPGNSCILPLFGVLVVPKLASRLLSTNQLTYHQHTVTFNQSSIDFGIIDNLHGGVQEFLIYRLPRQFVLSENGQSLE